MGPSTKIKPVERACTLLEFLHSFRTACRENPALTEVLKEACHFNGKMVEVLSLDWEAGNSDNDVVKSLPNICRSAAERFRTLLDAKGLEWIRTVTVTAKGDEKQALKTAKEVLAPPTKFLADCLQTCGLTDAELSKTELGAKLSDLATAMPLYMKTCSVNEDLMKQISEERFGMCQSFISKVDAKLAEHIDTINQTVEQVQKLDDKYKWLA